MRRWRDLITYGTSLLLSLTLLECVSFIFFEKLTGSSFDRTALMQKRAERITKLHQTVLTGGDQTLLYQFHPYVGYVGRAGVYPWGPSQPPFNAYGMLSVPDHPYPYKKRPQEFVIGVLGGSVADIFSNLGQDALNRALQEEWPGFNRQVVLINLATGGFKQPQQLFHLEYALLSGFEFDLVLNLDGFNELALASENIRQGINPIFPSGQHMGLMARFSETLPDPQLVEDLSQYYRLHMHEISLLSFLSKTPFRYSVFLNLVGERWTARNQIWIKNFEYEMTVKSQQSIITLQLHDVVTGSEHPLKVQSQELGRLSSFLGPRLDNVSAKNEHMIAASIWQHSSRMLHAVSRSQGLPYIHILQPNQYVEGSKPLTEKEKAVAINPKNPWSVHARDGYKYLVRFGKQLQQDGIAFYDLTMVFKEHTEDLYQDECCHFGQKGVDIIAEQVANILRSHLKPPREASSKLQNR